MQKLDLFDERGNVPKSGGSPQFSDLEVVILVLTVENMSLNSENWLFKRIESDFSSDFPHLIERTRFNRRRRQLFVVVEKISQQFAH